MVVDDHLVEAVGSETESGISSIELQLFVYNSIRDIPDSIHRCRFSTYASVVQERLLKSFLHSEVAPAQFERRARLVSLFVKSLQDKSES